MLIPFRPRAVFYDPIEQFRHQPLGYFYPKAFFSEYSLQAPGPIIDSSVSALGLLARLEERIAYSSRREIAHSSHGSVEQEML
jgi:hypothetical protein